MLNRSQNRGWKNISSKGVHVGVVTDGAIYGLSGHKLYKLKGTNIYKRSGELMGHLNASPSTDRLFREGAYGRGERFKV
jgi:hypothetical protein